MLSVGQKNKFTVPAEMLHVVGHGLYTEVGGVIVGGVIVGWV